MPLQADTAKTQSANVTKANEILESMWWKADDQMGGFAVLTNTSTNPVTTNIQLLNSDGSESISNNIVIEPNNTSMLDLRPLWNQLGQNVSAGGIRISYSGPRDAIVANGGLEDAAKGYSLRLAFFPRELPAPGTLTASPQVISVASPGVMVGSQDADMQFPKGTSFTPYMTLRNTTAQPINVQIGANYMNSGSPVNVALGAVTLPAETVKPVNLAAMFQSAGIGTFSGYLNLLTSFKGLAGDLLIATGSVDQTLNYVFEVPPSKTTKSNARSLCYWNAAGDTDTMLTLWNQSTKDQDFIVTIFHSQGQYQLPMHLSANGSTTLSLSSIIKKGTPDINGNVIPIGITEGSAKIAGSMGDQEVINVASNFSVFNVRTATCSAPCSHCIGIAGSPYTSPTSLTLEVGQSSSSVDAYVMYDNTLQVDESTALTWYMDSTSVATTGGWGSQTVTAATVGSTYLEAYPTDPDGIVDGGGVENCHNYGDGWGCDMTDPGWLVPVTVSTPDFVIIGWIDATQVTLPGGEDPAIQTDLNSAACSGLLGEWAVGIPDDLATQEDKDYANAFLIKNSANTSPSLTSINPATVKSGGDFRFYVRYQATYNQSGGYVSSVTTIQDDSAVGKTPDPCGILSPVSAETDANSGSKGITLAGTGVYKLVEGRIGSVGQAINLTINAVTTPYVWGVIKFDASGNFTYSQSSVFPTLYVYKDTVYDTGHSQAAPSVFASYTATYHLDPSQIQ
jgi:hypothetical protein